MIPALVEQAMRVVQKYHPEVCRVEYSEEETWLYTDHDGVAPEGWNVPAHEHRTLEAACDSIDSLPAKFYVSNRRKAERRQ